MRVVDQFLDHHAFLTSRRLLLATRGRPFFYICFILVRGGSESLFIYYWSEDTEAFWDGHLSSTYWLRRYVFILRADFEKKSSPH
jgi:hypothetical protein